MTRYGKNITIEKVHNGTVTSTERFEEDSLSIQDKAELVRELLVCADNVLEEGVEVSIKLEPATNGSYLLRLVKSKQIK